MEVEKMNSNSLQSSKGETCIICDIEKMAGIHLYTSFICVDCEKKMTSTQTSDPKYQYYLEKLRRVKNPPLYS
ncbi:sigma factor G inhibitor Gin [Metabacillus sp. BG109]|uniref:Sigma factor G inhibitor Gin n=2 Tax=Metabacillus bambusae TaxID=2795218 RepID=A0ABS3N9Y5_9BACI|nr:sigma factor G inhibitor Gin [Metabacillus bambusae]